MAEKRKNSRKKTDAKDKKVNQILTLAGLAIAAVRRFCHGADR